jgi:hypothetical protein
MLEGQYGPIGSPVGMFGINLDYALDPNVSLTGGIGMSWPPRSQFSLMGRPRVFVSDLAIFGGLGVSAGSYIPIFQGFFQGGYYTEHGLNPAIWFNSEIGIENRKDRISFRLSLGISQLVNASSWECRSIQRGKPANDWRSCGSPQEGILFTWLPYFNITVGYTL